MKQLNLGFVAVLFVSLVCWFLVIMGVAYTIQILAR